MRTKKQLAVVIFSFALLLGMLPVGEISAASKVRLSATKLTVTKGKKKTLTVKNSKKAVKWKVLAGRRCIILRKKSRIAVTIMGKEKGIARVQAIIGAKRLTCRVTVKIAKSGTQTKAPVVTAPPAGPYVPSDPGFNFEIKPLPIATPDNNYTVNPNPTPAPTFSQSIIVSGSHEEDVAILKALIAEQRERGATVSENLDSDEYGWHSGRLYGIFWNRKNLAGNLDVSGLNALTFLRCSGNQLSSLDVSSNVNLKSLFCGSNQLSGLDVSHNANLEDLFCDFNHLSSLDVSHNAKLEDLDCDFNRLSSLNVNQNEILWRLSCDSNQLSSLDVSHNVHLKRLICSANQLGSLNVSKNVDLESLSCYSNQLSHLDLSNNTKLVDFYCDDNVFVTGYNSHKRHFFEVFC